MIQSTTIYPLRNGEDLIVPFCRLSLINDSYLPSTVRKWNNLDPVIRNLDSVSKFKNELKKLDIQINPVPTYYAYGRKEKWAMYLYIKQSHERTFEQMFCCDRNCNILM